MKKDQIREIFLRNGFTIKEGQTDLKDYVYSAANELLAAQLEKAQEPHSYWTEWAGHEDAFMGEHVFELPEDTDGFDNIIPLYTSPPEVAELQKQITILRKQVNSYKTLVWSKEQLQLAAAEDKRTVKSMTSDNVGLAQCNSILTEESDALQKQVQALTERYDCNTALMHARTAKMNAYYAQVQALQADNEKLRDKANHAEKWQGIALAKHGDGRTEQQLREDIIAELKDKS